uniref:Uncharacterized protein n=1 Tax=viral metagenome TaxID=1070528 RepID=A0A6C0CIX5_9ZZZZ
MSGLGMPISILDEEGNVCETFVDYVVPDFCGNPGRDIPKPVEVNEGNK